MTSGKIVSAKKDESDIQGHGPGIVLAQGHPNQRWHVVIQNGEEKINTTLLRRPDSPDPTGRQAVFEENRWKVAPKDGSRNGGRDGKYEQDSRALRGKNASTAMSYAKDLVIAEKIGLDQMSLYANKIYDFVESKAKVGE